MVTLKPTQHPIVTESSLPSPGTRYSSESTDRHSAVTPFKANEDVDFESIAVMSSVPHDTQLNTRDVDARTPFRKATTICNLNS